MAENIFAYSLEVNKKKAELMGTELKTGKAAMADASKVVMRKSADESIFFVGDEIIVPAWDETNERWQSMPMSNKNDKPVFRCLVEVHNGDNVYEKELFMGTLRKTVQDRETGEYVSTSGTVVDLLKGIYMLDEAWQAVADKRLKVTAVKSVPVIKRGYNGNPDRPGTSNVLTIDVME